MTNLYNLMTNASIEWCNYLRAMREDVEQQHQHTFAIDAWWKACEKVLDGYQKSFYK